MVGDNVPVAVSVAVGVGVRVGVLVGVGVSNAQQAVEATKVADGVIQGASVMRRMLESGPDAVGEYVAEVRNALDLAHSTN